MSKKKTDPLVLEAIKKGLTAEKGLLDLEELTVKINLRDITREEKIQEASRPLYLKRYE